MISRRVTDQQPPIFFNLKPPTYPTGLAASTVLRPYAVGRFHGSSSPVTLALLRAVGCGASPQQLLLHCAAAGCPVLGDRRGGKLGRYRQRYRHPENWWLAYFQVWAVSSRECSQMKNHMKPQPSHQQRHDSENLPFFVQHLTEKNTPTTDLSKDQSPCDLYRLFNRGPL